MMNWTMNDKTVAQVEYYVARMQAARQKDETSLRSVIANLFSQEKDAAKDAAVAPAYMKPLSVPVDSAYALADYIIDLTGKNCEMTELFLEDQAAAVDQWLNEVAEDCKSAQELVERYDLIEKALKHTISNFRAGRNLVNGVYAPYDGEVTIEAAYALRGRIVATITAMNPSGDALRRMGKQLRGMRQGSVARFEHFTHGGLEVKAMTAAVIYALRCDGSLPAETDDVMLEQIIAEVCKNVDMQAIADTMQLSQDTYSTVYVVLSSVFVVSIAGALFTVVRGVGSAAVGAAIAANPALAIVAAFAVMAVMPCVFECVTEMIHETSAKAADFAREHEKDINAVKQAARAAREKCAAVFEKIADAVKTHVVDPVVEQVEQVQQQNVQQAEQSAQA